MMKMILFSLLCGLAFVATSFAAADESKKAGAPGQAAGLEITTNRAKPLVVCFGDSITKRGYPAILREMLRVEAINLKPTIKTTEHTEHTEKESLRQSK